MHKVSAVIITLNEERDISRALSSVSWCDEVVVVDSGSTDRTVAICQAQGCRVFHHDFIGYGDQKAFAVAQAANDWVLVLDADEEVTPELRDEIFRKLESPGDVRGFLLPITTILWDQVVRTQDRHTALKLRLFDKRYGGYGKQLVHESVALNGRIEPMHQRMYNHSYADISDYFEKFNRYTTAAALQCFREGKNAGVSGAVLRLPLTFIQFYWGRGYIRDGAVGLVWSLFSAFYPAVKYLKLWELQRTARQYAAQKPAHFPSAQERQANFQVKAEVSPEMLSTRAASLDATTARRKTLPLFVACVAAVAAAGLALLWMPLIGGDVPGDYAACLLFAVLVTAYVGGHRAALLATAASILALDYFTVGPSDALSLPRSNDLIRLTLFLALSLLTISVVYQLQRRPAR